MAAKKKNSITKVAKAAKKAETPQAAPDPVSLKPGELILRIPNVGERKTVNISSFYLDKCTRLLESLAEMVEEREVSCSPASDQQLAMAFHEMASDNRFRKMGRTQMAWMYEAFGSDLRNIISVCNVDARYEKAWKRLTQNFDVSTEDIKRDLGRAIRIERDYGWAMEIAPEVLFATALVTDAFERYNSSTGLYDITGCLSLRGSDRKALSEHFFGKEYSAPHLTPSLPDDAHLTVDNFEQATVTDLMTLDGVALNGSMLSSNGSISAAAVKKVKAQTDIRNFTGMVDRWPLDRVELLCLTYFTLDEIRSQKESIDIKRIAAFAADKMARYIVGPIFNSFMPAWQGFGKSWTEANFTVDISTVVRSVLIPASEQWMALDNFKMMLLCADQTPARDNRYLRLFSYKGRSKSTAVRKIDKEHDNDRKWKVKEIDWFEEMGFKFAVHWIKYLCAMGLVEIAMDTHVKDIDADPMEGMRFVRLTPLGRFAFGIDKDYTPKAAAADVGVEFDSRNGIITIPEKSPYQLFLSNVARRISPTRFSISAQTLLKGCGSKGDLELRVNNLSTVIDPDKQPALREMIDEAVRHTDCAEREGGYSLLKLRSDLPGLREIILTNKELREMTILAGHNLALVKTHKMERFNIIMAANGFLMN